MTNTAASGLGGSNGGRGDDTSCLLEQLRAQRLARGRRPVGLDRFAGALVEDRGDLNLEGGQQVALGAVGLGSALGAHPERATVRGTGRDLQGHRRATEGRHLDVRAERELVEGHGYVDGEVVALAAEQPVRRDLHGDEQVTGGAAVLTGRALAAQPDPLAVLDARGDAGLDRACRQAAPTAVAGGAGLVVHELAAAAAGAGLVDRERPAGGAGDEAGALALRADLGLGARLAAGALAVRAGRVGGQPQRDRDALDGVVEADRRGRLDVAALLRAAVRLLPTAASEQVAEHLAEPAAAAGLV